MAIWIKSAATTEIINRCVCTLERKNCFFGEIRNDGKKTGVRWIIKLYTYELTVFEKGHWKYVYINCMVCVYLYTYTLPPLSFAMNRKKNENTSRGRKNSNFVPASTSCAVFIRLCVVYISFNSISAACCRTAVAGFCYFFLLLLNDIFVFISFYPSPFPSSLPLIVRCLSSLSVVIIILLLYCRSSVAL